MPASGLTLDVYGEAKFVKKSFSAIGTVTYVDGDRVLATPGELGAAAVMGPGTAFAADYPAGPLTMIIPLPPGTVLDVIASNFAELVPLEERYEFVLNELLDYLRTKLYGFAPLPGCARTEEFLCRFRPLVEAMLFLLPGHFGERRFFYGAGQLSRADQFGREVIGQPVNGLAQDSDGAHRRLLPDLTNGGNTGLLARVDGGNAAFSCTLSKIDHTGSSTVQGIPRPHRPARWWRPPSSAGRAHRWMCRRPGPTTGARVARR